MKHTLIITTVCLLSAFILLVFSQFLYVKYTGTYVAAPEIPRSVQSFGSVGPELKYAIMGDSTSIGQGANYYQSYAYASARHLAKNHQVKLLNVGVSGAVAKDLTGSQLAKVENYKPDVVLLAVGANDARRFTSGSSMENSLRAIINGLKKANPRVLIVTTGCPAMSPIPRFPDFGASQLIGVRERQINQVYSRIIAKNNLVLAPIAQKTGPAFQADPSLFAPDKYHPNARGYALWTPVVNKALDTALGVKR